MNTIFKKIRSRLLKINKLKRYLIYAVGEIFLVVIGILIALQVNNHNELRKKNNIEKQFILNIKSELETESLALKK